MNEEPLSMPGLGVGRGSFFIGVLTLGKNITKMKNLNMIMQSVTGLFEQKIDLGTL